MARKKPAGNDDNEELLRKMQETVGASEPEPKTEPKPKPAADIDAMRDKSRALIVRKRLADPFDPGNVTVKTRKDGAKYLLLHPSAIADRLDEVLGVENWSLRSSADGCTLVVRIGDATVARNVRVDHDDFTNELAFACAASFLGIGRYLDRLPDYHELPSKLPEWAVPRVSDGLPVYGQWRAGEKATAPVAAVAKESVKNATRVTAPPPEPEKEPQKNYFATPADTAKWWANLVTKFTPDQLNLAMREHFVGIPKEHKPDAWAAVLVATKERGWVYDKESKEFFEPDDGEPDAPASIPW